MSEPAEDPWGLGQVTCDVCGETWTALYPLHCDRIECVCGHMTRAPHCIEALPEAPREPWHSAPDNQPP